MKNKYKTYMEELHYLPITPLTAGPALALDRAASVLASHFGATIGGMRLFTMVAFNFF